DVGADARHFRAEQLLDRTLDLDLVRVRGDLEHDRAPVFAQNRRLLGDERTTDDVGLFHVNLAGFRLWSLGFGACIGFCKSTVLAKAESLKPKALSFSRAPPAPSRSRREWQPPARRSQRREPTRARWHGRRSRGCSAPTSRAFRPA